MADRLRQVTPRLFAARDPRVRRTSWCHVNVALCEVKYSPAVPPQYWGSNAPTHSDRFHASMYETAELPPRREARVPRRLGPLSTWNALLLALVLLVVVIAALEWREYRRAQDDLHIRARTAAALYAGRLVSRLDAHFAALRFLASTLRDGGNDHTAESNARLSQSLNEFLRLDPGLMSVAVLSPAGDAVIASAGTVSQTPSSTATSFSPLAGQPNEALDIASQDAPEFVGLRFRKTDVDGQALFVLSAQYRTAALLASTNDFSPPWTLTTVNAQNDRSLGDWRAGKVYVGGPSASPPGETIMREDVPGYPLRVLAALPSGYATSSWVNASLKRWALEALLLLSFAVLVLLVRHNRRQNEQRRQELHAAAERDGLTGLLNREGLKAQLVPLSTNLAPSHQLAVIVIDLYRFAEINDRWGRDAGDSVLLQVAERLRSLPEVKALARVGADSFALIYRGLEIDEAQARMESVIRSVTPSFLLQHDFRRKITASVGCALYPEDTSQPQELLGLAEAALFTRTERENSARVTNIDLYGPASAAQLAWAERFLARRFVSMAEGFYKQLEIDPENARILGLLSPDALAVLKSRQAQYLRLLTSPSLTAETHRKSALHLGEVHALIGVSNRALIGANGAHYRTLVDLSKRIPGRLSQQQFLNRVLYLRLQNDLSLQAEAALALQLRLQKQVRELSQALQDRRQWADMVDRILEHLAEWPFIAGCAIHAQNVGGEFVIEAQSASHAHLSTEWTSHGSGVAPMPAAALIAESWLQGTVASLPTLPGGGTARSAAAVPLLDRQSHAQAVLALYGRLPNQFETPWVRDVLGNLCSVFTEALQRLRTEPSRRLSADERAHWRTRLFSGGLQMYMQPIVNLRHGRCTKVEALARLQLEDGRVI